MKYVSKVTDSQVTYVQADFDEAQAMKKSRFKRNDEKYEFQNSETADALVIKPYEKPITRIYAKP